MKSKYSIFFILGLLSLNGCGNNSNVESSYAVPDVYALHNLNIISPPQEELLNEFYISSMDFHPESNLIYWVSSLKNQLGTLDPQTKETKVLLEDLKSPIKIVAKKDRVFFTEFGTTKKEYQDGRLSYLDIKTNTLHHFMENLNAPQGLFLTEENILYWSEIGKSGTSLPGEDRFCRALLQENFKVNQEKIECRKGLTSVMDIVVNQEGKIYMTIMGPLTPGNGGQMQMIESFDDPGISVPLSDISSPGEMRINGEGLIYFTGYGTLENDFAAIMKYNPKTHKLKVIKNGVYANGLCLGSEGSIFYSTGRTEHNVYRMQL